MIRVLIVDDEIYAVKGLCSGVRWEEIGVDEIYEAYHAPIAQQVLLNNDIDIVICDIEMPETSGLELMEWVKEQGLQPEIIVLTCHSEFSYAQKAMHLGGFEYLLKPVVYTELEQVLMMAISRVLEKRRISETDDQYNKIIELWNGRVGATGGLSFRPNSVSPVVHKVKAHIAENLNEELTREQLAAVAFVNPAYLSRLFRKETGMVLTDYILQEKMGKAAELLATTDQSISEIADKLHYGNFSYFARLFRKVHGVTPHDYRKPFRREHRGL